jgi:hypothetical protein
MGLFDWLKPTTRTHGPTPEGLPVAGNRRPCRGPLHRTNEGCVPGAEWLALRRVLPNPGECVIPSVPYMRFMYTLGMRPDGKPWGGVRDEDWFCVTDGRFTTAATSACQAGVDRRIFSRIDTGGPPTYRHVFAAPAEEPARMLPLVASGLAWERPKKDFYARAARSADGAITSGNSRKQADPASGERDAGSRPSGWRSFAQDIRLFATGARGG